MGITTLAESSAVFSVLGAAGSVVVFLYGVLQYSVAQRWKRQEFVASEVEKFFSNRDVATACLLLDYSVVAVTPDGRIAVDENAAGRRVFKDADIMGGLVLHTVMPGETETFRGSRLAARVAFDAFFTGLEKLSNHVASGVIERRHLIPYLAYWLAIISEPETGWKDREFYRIVSDFIDGYGYVGVRRLIETSAFEIRPMALSLAAASRMRTAARGTDRAQEARETGR